MGWHIKCVLADMLQISLKFDGKNAYPSDGETRNVEEVTFVGVIYVTVKIYKKGASELNGHRIL